MWWAGLLCSALWLGAASAAGAANLIVNGSFEDGPTPGDSLALATGSTAVTGWVVTGAGIDYAGTVYTAASGFRSISLNGPGPGGIAQRIPTLPRGLYSVRFYAAGDPDTEPLLKNLRVSAAGQSGDFTADITGMWAWDPGWNPHMWSFRAESLSTKIEFTSLMSGVAGPTIDSVTVEVASLADVPARDPELALAAIAPNPSRGASRIAFDLPSPVHARLAVFDLAGREVAVVFDGEASAGAHTASWDGRVAGARAAPGVYRVELLAGSRRIVRNLVIIP